MLVLIVTVLNGITFTSHKVYAAPTPSQVNDAITKFVDAVGKFLPVGEDVTKIAEFVTRLGGIASAASGIIGILQMCGVIKDPVLEMLGQILDAVKDVQTTLQNMNNTLNDISKALIQIQVSIEEKARNADATRMSKYWNDFNTDYTKKLKTYVNEYQAKINSGIKKWWEETSHEGVCVLMTKKYTEENPLTYSRQDFDKRFPEKSDISGDIINIDWSLRIPSEYMPDTQAVTFNINTYRDDFKKLMAPKLEEAINDRLMYDYGREVQREYDRLTEEDRKKMLESYADQVMNTEIYKIACEVMTDNNVWIAQVISTYMQYCDNILQRDSGVNAFLNYIFNTHAFERDKTFCECMIAQAGFYGEFALTCAGQTIETKEKIREYFVNTVLNLSERKSKAITGHLQ